MPGAGRIRVVSRRQPVATKLSPPQLSAGEGQPERSPFRIRVNAPPRSPKAAPAPLSYQLPSGGKVNVVWSPEARMNLITHCEESNEHGVEVCGLLLGRRQERRGPSGAVEYRLMVTDILRLKTADASGAHVIASEDAWAEAEREIEQKFQPLNKERLGWYHTHPTQGIFFSGQDCDFHGVFTKEHQFALVVDPREMKGGIFYWEDHLTRSLAAPLLCDLRAPAELKRPDTRSFFRELIHTCVVLLVAVLALSAWNYWRSSESSAQVAWVIYSTALTVIVLRLWNLKNWRRPWVVEHADRRPRKLAQAIRHIVPLGSLLLAGGVTFYGMYGDTPEEVLSRQMLKPPIMQQTRAREDHEDITIAVLEHRPFVYFVWDGKLAIFEWTDQHPKPIWGERELLEKILGKKLTPEGYRGIQKSIGVDADGDWRDGSRRAFLEKASKGEVLPITKGRKISWENLREE
jgi:proteasome lid subunit RPN8/RPN11